MSSRRPRIAGLLAALAALATGELVAGLLGAPVSPVEAVGNLVIDVVPPAVKDAAIALFGTGDKPALIVGIAVVVGAIGWVAGGVAARSFATGSLFYLGAGGLALVALGRDERVGWGLALVMSAAATLAGLGALAGMLRLAQSPDGASDAPGPSAGPADPGRRRFLVGAGALAGVIVVAAAGGRALLERAKVTLAGRDEVVLPTPAAAQPPPGPAASLDVPHLSPVVTPTSEFYRIDTALSVPKVDLETWALRVTGNVDKEVVLTYADLLDLPMEERYVTLSCVSNEVGGDLVGNALWLGTPLRGLFDAAGIDPGAGAEQVVGRSVDGFTVGFPVDAVYDGRTALVAVGMNGEPLPFEHGFPARLVVAGLYGYVSATKWLSEIEITTWDGFDAYWIPRGWAKEAPVKTQSRIDTPRHGSVLEAAPRAIAGVAWAPDRGIAGVEVRVDDGPWLAAELSEALSGDAWVQWRVPWDPTPGRHVIQVRATDGAGVTQDEQIRPPAPDGATGYHTVAVRVG